MTKDDVPHINKVYEEEDDDTQKNKYLSFRLSDEEYCIQISNVIEIVSIQHIATMPDMPNYLKGIINLRGQVIPVMDIRLRFKMPEKSYDERTCVIVVRVDDIFVGLIVDIVKEVADIKQENITEPPRIARSESAHYIAGIARINEHVKIIIDVNKLLFDEEKILKEIIE